VMLATISDKAAAIAAPSADTLPPPGTGSLDAVLARNSVIFSSDNNTFSPH